MYMHQMEVQLRYRVVNTHLKESLFQLKDKNTHPSHVIYQGKCICGQTLAKHIQHATSRFVLMNI